MADFLPSRSVLSVCFPGCVLTSGEAEQQRKSKEIDKCLSREKTYVKRLVKILLLGAGESGKSTFLKQMRIIHGREFDQKALLEFRDTIFDNILKVRAPRPHTCAQVRAGAAPGPRRPAARHRRPASRTAPAARSPLAGPSRTASPVRPPLGPEPRGARPAGPLDSPPGGLERGGQRRSKQGPRSRRGAQDAPPPSAGRKGGGAEPGEAHGRGREGGAAGRIRGQPGAAMLFVGLEPRQNQMAPLGPR